MLTTEEMEIFTEVSEVQGSPVKAQDGVPSTSRERNLTEQVKEMREKATKKWGESLNAAYDRWKVIAKETRAKLKLFVPLRI